MLRPALRLACAVSPLTGVLGTSATAQTPTFTEKTYFTFNAPISLPGITLPAGRYLFKLANPESGRNVIQVSSADGTIPYGLFLSMPTSRPEGPAAPEVALLETRKNVAAAMRAWWYPGKRTGYEFIYPREQARRLAELTGQPVLASRAISVDPAALRTADLVRILPSGEEVSAAAFVPGPISQ